MILSKKLITLGARFVSETYRFDYMETPQVFTVPAHCKKLLVDCVAGSADAGGKGGRVQCELSVTPNEVLYMIVGGILDSPYSTIYNASDIRTAQDDLYSRIIVAGGAGGHNVRSTYRGAAGGDGGGLVGGDGVSDRTRSGGGYGGTQTAGGARGSGGSGSNYGSAGTFGRGGGGGFGYAEGGRGGDGWYGGGGGTTFSEMHQQGLLTIQNYYAGGGGGGSSYTDSVRCKNVTHTQGYNTVNTAGYIQITTLQR